MNWSVEELNYLENKWGDISIPAIAKNLNRSINAVVLKANRTGLGMHLHSGNEITLFQLISAMGKKNNFSWYVDKWIRYGIPFKYKKSINKRYKVIKIEDFWKWAVKNKDILDFSTFEENMLGKEPIWVIEKRKADIIESRYKKTPWTKEEDNLLRSLLNSYRFSYIEISKRLNRTEGGIKRRMQDLKIKQRPLKADNHIAWSNEETELLIRLRNEGYRCDVISEKIKNRSAQAVRGKLERMNLI